MRAVLYRIVLAIAAVVGAGVAAFVAIVLDWLACFEGPSELCDRKDLAQLQLWVALGGLAPVVALAVSLVARWRVVAWVTFVVSVGVYLTWAVLADAAHHGWDDLKFFPF